MKRIRSILLAVLILTTLGGCTAAETSNTSAQKEQGTLYTTVIQNSGEDESAEKYLEIAERSQTLFPLLEEQVGLFVLNTYNYQDVDGEGTPLYTMNTLHAPAEIDPNGKSIQVSRNFLTFYPIETVSGSSIEDALSDDDLTLNVLVPEQYRAQEETLRAAWLAQFFLEKVEAENSYCEWAGRAERSHLTQDQLSLNLIYVKDGQKYPVLREGCVSEDGWITDPVVEVYTGNVHCNYAHSLLSQWSYFYADTDDPKEAFELLRPSVEACGAAESFQKVELAG